MCDDLFNVQQARKKVIKLIRKTIENRKACCNSNNDEDDILNSLISESGDQKYDLDDEEINDQIITILNSGYETVSKTTMMIVKYLHDHPKALQELRVSSLLFSSSFLNCK